MPSSNASLTRGRRAGRAIGATLALAFVVAAVPSLASARPLPTSVATALATIERDADAVARGRVGGASIAGPAREIGVAWATVEPQLLKDGDVLVETKMANTSIASFEANWKKPASAKSDAAEVKSRIADLIAAARS